MCFMAVKNLRRRCGFVFYSYLKDSAVNALSPKSDQRQISPCIILLLYKTEWS